MTVPRAGFLVAFLAVAAYANSLGNGFAYDDEGIIVQNPVVTEGNWLGALSSTWWPEAQEGTGLYRPLTAASFALEWKLFQGSPLGYHALNLVFHAAGSILVFLLLLELATLPGALFGAALFAIHPLHTEAVANVVGRGELYAAVPYLLACILYWKGRQWRGIRRVGRLLGLGALYLLSLAGKEIGVTLPGVLVLLELFAPALEGDRSVPTLQRLGREAATFLLLGVVLLAYLSARFVILGTLGGELEAPIFQLVGSRARVLTAIAVWFQYARLLLFPLDLASDYDPGVLFPSEGLDGGVLLGAGVLLVLAWSAIRSWRTRPLVSLRHPLVRRIGSPRLESSLSDGGPPGRANPVPPLCGAFAGRCGGHRRGPLPLSLPAQGCSGGGHRRRTGPVRPDRGTESLVDEHLRRPADTQ